MPQPGGSLRGDLASLAGSRERARVLDGLPAEQRPAAVPPAAWARTAAAGVVRESLRTVVLRPALRALVSPSVAGLELLAGLRPPFVIVANHASHLDTPLILAALPRALAVRTTVGAASDYFFASPVAGALSAGILNAFPVDRFGADRHRQTSAAQLLADGWNVLVHPEGTRTDDGWMRRFRLGAARLCLEAHVPVVPVALRGTYAAMPRGRRWPDEHGPRITVRFGRPLVPTEGESVPQLRDRIQRHVAALYMEEDQGWYRSMRALHEGRLEPPPGRTGALPGVAGSSRTPDGEVGRWRRIWQATARTQPVARGPIVRRAPLR
ncbi:lysophospholipid acyltransferase family protein [Streptomyces sp. NPDC007325]|uniref:lysophospholipid acyltransferase family protein n=1 Tax=Streptomyces sp. NPDC007325 TaxID=3154588 RepID=UPI0033E12E8F